MNLTDFNNENRLSFGKAGEAITKKDPLFLDSLTGRLFKCDTTDYAAIGEMAYGTAQTSEATGRIVAQTNLSPRTLAHNRQAALRNTSGHIFVASNYSGANGVTLRKVAPNGQILASVDTETSGTPAENHHVLELSNGNIAILYELSGAIKYAVYDTNLAVVKSVTALPAEYAPYFSACSLSGGGFAVLYQPSAASLTSSLATFDNAGTAVLAPTVIWTRTGTTGSQYHKISQLSNGNLAYAISSTNTVSSIGLYHGVTDTSGSIIAAFAALSAVSSSRSPELSVISGYYAIAIANGTNQKAFILSNAGVLQGSEFSSATTSGNAMNKIKLCASATEFYLIWHRSSDSNCVLSKLPVSGVGYTTSIITTITTQFNFYLDAFYEDGYICAISMSGSTTASPTMWVLSASTMLLIDNSGTTFGTAASSSTGAYPRVLSGGDRSFIAIYDYQASSATLLCIGKWAETAIIGVAETTAAAAATVAINALVGCHEMNTMVGTHSKAFDMTANDLMGNKGTLVANGACTLQGMGV